jgi:glycosyltransferase involved in cell wall biosynthesis
MKDVSLIFETDNEAPFHEIRLHDAMRAWRDQTAADRVLEWIVVSPRKATPEEERIMEGVEVRWLERDGLLYYEQKNAAIAVSRGNWVAMADSDGLPAPDWLEKALEAIEKSDPSVALISGSTTYAPGPFSRELTLAHFPVQGAGPADVKCACANNTIFRGDIVRAIPFPGGHIRHGADMELARRAGEAGFRTRFDPSLRLVHNFARRSRELWSHCAFKGYCFASYEEFLGQRRRGPVINGLGRFRVLLARLFEMRRFVGIPARRVPLSLLFYAWYCVAAGSGYSRALQGAPEPVSTF